jgi:hypothetical protein
MGPNTTIRTRQVLETGANILLLSRGGARLQSNPMNDIIPRTAANSDALGAENGREEPMQQQVGDAAHGGYRTQSQPSVNSMGYVSSSRNSVSDQRGNRF